MRVSIVPRDRPKDTELGWVLLSLLLLGTGLLKAGVPFLASRLIPGCFLKERLGIRCPTCGTGTSLMLLAEGKIRAAFEANWLVPIALLMLLLFDLYFVGTFILRHKIAIALEKKESLALILGGLSVLALSWIYQLTLRP